MLTIDVQCTIKCSMPPEQTETLTIRIPSSLKSLVEQFAEAQGLTVTAVVREALQGHIAPSHRRVYELPGFSEKLDQIIKDSRAGQTQLTILCNVDREPGKLFFEGVLDKNLSNDTLIALRRNGGRKPWIIPRRDVVAWFEGSPGNMNSLAMSLTELGWTAMNKDLY